MRVALGLRSEEITIYDSRQQYGYLKPTDVIGVEGTADHDGQQVLVKITSIRLMKGAELMSLFEQAPHLRHSAEKQLGREIKPRDKVHVIEAMVIQRWQIEQKRPVL